MTELKLPFAMAELRPILGEIVGLGLQRAPYFSALLSSRHGLTIVVDNREEQINEQPPSAGTVLSAFDGVTNHERAIGGFNREEIRNAARDFTTGISFQKSIFEAEPERRGDFVTPVEIDPLAISTQEKLDRCREVHQRVKGRDPRIVNVRVTYRESNEHAVFADASADLAQRVQRVTMFIFVIVAGPEGYVRYDYDYKAGSAGWEILTWSDEEIQKVVDGALLLLRAERIEPGEYRIITTPNVSGVLAHESFGHGVETDMFLKERARAALFIDKVVGSTRVNIADDPSQAGSYGSYFFDDEGQRAAPTQIVEHGVFRRGITDRYSAMALEIPRSANGRRQDYSRKAYARMSNTFFSPGTSTLDDRTGGSWYLPRQVLIRHGRPAGLGYSGYLSLWS
jgi:TldD protein